MASNSSGQPKGASFTSTPQAKDDFFGAALTGLDANDVSSAAPVFLDVMANDLGGNAKSLYALDAGAEGSDSLRQAALIGQDNSRTEALSTDRSAHGAHIWITTDGKLGYDASTLDASFVDQLHQLTSGQYLTDTFIYAVRLGNGTLSWATATVQIAGVTENHAPVAADDNYSTNEGTALTVAGPGVLGNDSDVDSPSITAALVSGPAHGSLSLNADGSFTYTPVANYNGSDSFTYKASDGSLDSNIATVNLTINAVNDAPVLNDAVPTGVSQTALGITATADMTFTDADLTDTHILVSIQPLGTGYFGHLNGQLTQDSVGTGTGTLGLTFTLTAQDEALLPPGGQQQSYRITIRDSQGATAFHDVTIPVGASGGGHSPTVFPVFGTGTEDGPSSTLDALANASDSDANAVLQIVNVSPLFPGVAYNEAAHSFTLDPANSAFQHLGDGQSQVVSVNYSVTNGSGQAPGSVSWTVFGMNDAPVTTSVPTASVHDDPLQITLTTAGFLFFTDVDDGDLHTVSVSPAPGSTLLGQLSAQVTAESGGNTQGHVNWSYVVDESAVAAMAADTSHTDTFAVTVNDGHGGHSTQNINVTVSADRSPFIFGGNQIDSSIFEFANQVGGATSHGTAGQISFSDPDPGDTLHVSLLSQSLSSNESADVLVPELQGNGDLLLVSHHVTLAQALTADEIQQILGGFVYSTGPGVVPNSGVINWSYGVFDHLLDALSDGGTLTVHSTLLVDDQHGGQSTASVDVVLHGANDAPYFAQSGGATDSFSVNPGGVMAGDVQYFDPDLIDTHSITVTHDGPSIGTLHAGLQSYADPQNTSTTFSGDFEGLGGGYLHWVFTADASATVPATETFHITLHDLAGASIEHTLMFSLMIV